MVEVYGPQGCLSLWTLRHDNSYFTQLVFKTIISFQVVSLKWYLRRRKLNKPAITASLDTSATESSVSTSKISKYSVIGLHCAQLGIFWRYAKLFVPVDLRYVKHEVRDLCILRLIHAFCEAAPMLLIQCYILMTMQANEDSNLNSIKIKTLGGQLSTHLVQQSTIVHQYQQKTFKDLNTISAFLSLFSVCWALASFSKNVRVHNVHRLVLTWLGVIFQFFWRLGTVTSRVLSLIAYASVYKKWIFLVISEFIIIWVLTKPKRFLCNFSSSLDFDVPLADLAEERVPWRTDIEV